MNCPHDGNSLEEHLTGASKAGRQHCYDCGCCFEKDGKTVRVQACDFVSLPPTPEAEPEVESPAVTRGRPQTRGE
jgi:hypothetical protein